MVAKLLKDAVCKYKTMQGYKVIRKVGWDTHGLPVEVQVEKELGFQNKGDIEKYGIEPFNKKCKESVRRNEKTFTDLTEKMGQFIDTENPYVTYDNNYIETEWYILKKFFEEDLFLRIFCSISLTVSFDIIFGSVSSLFLFFCSTGLKVCWDILLSLLEEPEE